ncbi:putative cytochrome P450, partial [Trichophaea hybrida]
LPQKWQDYFNITTFGAHWRVKGRMAERYGGVYLTVSAARVACFVSDAEAANEIMIGRERFPKPVKSYETLTVFGTNIVATEGREWTHHRKHAVAPFGERNYKLVWKESLQQAADMAETWEAKSYQPDTPSNCMSLALHVISAAGFGIPMKFADTEERPVEEVELFTDGHKPPKGFSFSFRQALQFITANMLQHALIIRLMPRWIPKEWFSYTHMHQQAHTDFSRYLREMVAKSHTSPGGTSNLLDLLVAAEKTSEDAALSLSELMGNIFIFTVAGHETTAQSLHYAFLMMALHPEMQQWVCDGIDKALEGQSRDIQKWKYEEVFPKLVTPLCLMLETLRLFPVVPYIPKSTGESGTTLTYGGRTVHLRPMYIAVSATSVQRSPAYYGPSADVFDPTRWDATNTNSFLSKNKGQQGLMAAGLEYPTIHKPERGAFFPFSDRARGCLGRKFAQVTFVAVIAVVFRDLKVRIKELEGETREMTENRAWRAIEESYATLSLRVTESLPLVFEKR